MVQTANSDSAIAIENTDGPKIRVIGIGGGGSNAVKRMFGEPIPTVEYIGINTDSQALLQCNVPTCLRIGDRLTRGLGVGGNPELGRQAAEESRSEIKDLVADTDMVFVAAGMGGGTGTGAISLVAEVAKEQGALTIGVVTKPFLFEGNKRTKAAVEGIARLKDKVDTLIVIPNERLITMADVSSTTDQVFRMADDVLQQGVRAIAEIVTVPGEINLDFADVKTVMSNAGPAWMGIGHGIGDNKATDAAKEAIDSPLLEVSIEGAKGVIYNVMGGTDLTLTEVHEAAQVINNVVDPDADIFFGVANDLKMENEVTITLIATGFPSGDETTNSHSQLKIHNNGSTKSSEESGLEIPPFLRRNTTAKLMDHTAT